MFTVDWAGLGTRISNMALDVKKAAEERTHMLINYLGIAGIILIIIGLIYLFKKK